MLKISKNQYSVIELCETYVKESSVIGLGILGFWRFGSFGRG